MRLPRTLSSLLSILTVTVSSSTVHAEDFKLGEVKPGLEGTAVTAGVGNVLQRFDVRVLETLRDGDLPFVLVRASGKFLDEVGGVGQGFSGSPVYIGDKLLGAISGGFPNGDHRLALVTPIEIMRRAAAPISTLRQYGLDPLESFASRQLCLEGHGCAAPLATPLSVSGLSHRGVLALQSELETRGLNATVAPLQGASGSTAIRPFKLEPGAPISAQLASGDVSIGAVGTVTTVEGKNVLAFGHEVFGDARVKYLMHGAYVLGFVNSSTVPFKLAEPVGNAIGLFSTDRPYGLGGATGVVAPLPLEVTVKRGKDTAMTRVNLAPVEDLAGALGLATTLSALDNTLEVNTPGSARLTWRLEFTDRAPVEYGDRVADPDDVAMNASRRAGLLLALIAENPYRAANLKKLSLTLEVVPYTAFRVLRADAERKTLKAGESTTLNLRLQPYRGASVQKRIAFRIPADTEPGKLKLRVRGAGTPRPPTAQVAPDNPDPWDGVLTFDELLERMRSRVTQDYAVIETTGETPVVIGLEPMNDVVTGWVYVDVQVTK